MKPSDDMDRAALEAASEAMERATIAVKKRGVLAVKAGAVTFRMDAQAAPGQLIPPEKEPDDPEDT